MTRHEKQFAAAVAERFALALRYARTGIGLALEALHLERGGRVLLSPLTCKVVPLAVLATGLRPAFVDIDDSTLNLDGSRAGPSWGDCGSVLFQHTYGLGAGLGAVLDEARSIGLPVIEDCAQVLPGHREAGGTRGTGLAAVYSNNLGKPLPAGSGGMLVTSSPELFDFAERRRAQLPSAGLRERVGMRLQRLGRRLLTPRTYWPLFEAYRRVAPSYKDRPLADLIASEVTRVAGPPTASQERWGRTWLDELPRLARHRTGCVTGYLERLGASSIVEIPEAARAAPLYYMPVLTPNKGDVLEIARKRRVEIVPWPGSTPIYPVESWTEAAKLGYERGMCPRAESVADRLVGLPTHLGVGPHDMDRVVELLSVAVA